jgi:ABC-type lipoprotein export system ATPase subunit
LANDPRLLLADEPTGSLDSASVGRVMSLLDGVRASGVTIVLVTHDAAIAASGDRVITMRDGRVVADEVAATA